MTVEKQEKKTQQTECLTQDTNRRERTYQQKSPNDKKNHESKDTVVIMSAQKGEGGRNKQQQCPV